MRVAWQFNGWKWAINPETDSGWTAEEIMAEQNAINDRRSNIQFGGTKSARRQIHGWIIGPNGPVQLQKMQSWKANRTQATLRDHMGASRKAILLRFDLEFINSVTEWNAGRQAYKYNAEFIAAD